MSGGILTRLNYIKVIFLKLDWCIVLNDENIHKEKLFSFLVEQLHLAALIVFRFRVIM